MSALDYNYVADLVVKAQNSDSDAFAELYAATYQKQYQFAYSYLKDEYLAQDALQETYIIAFKDLSKLKDPLLVLAWLNQINFRVCFKMHQKQKRYSAEIADYENFDGEPPVPPPRDSSSLFRSGYNPEDVVVQIDSREYIINQILTLPFTEAQTILLRFYGNLKYDEIAGLMDISRSSVKRYLKSGMNHLVKIFQPQKGEFYP